MAVISLIVFAIAGAAGAHELSRPTVTLPSGPVVGTTTTLASATAPVNKFFGIPFAASPPERFSPPSSPSPWLEPLDASTLKPACIQQFTYPEADRNRTMEIFNTPGGGSPPEESEDCLYLNVFAPSAPAPDCGRAVMVWYFGGALEFGTASLSFYDGSSFASNQDVIIVTTNYRTNVFGYSNSPEIKLEEQNSGFLDQRKTLEWVQENIAAFGGDPSKITIFGESAGGYSVKQLIAAPPDPLPFRAAILESEATTTADGNASYNSLLELTNCANTTSPLNCLRAVPATTLKSLIEQNILVFPPVIDNVTNINDFRDAVASGTAAKVPILIGTNADEGRVIAYDTGVYDAKPDVKALLNASYPGDYDLQNAILAAYPPDVVQDPYLFVSAYITDLQFQCPASALANLTANAGYDVWRYYFEGVFPNLQWFPEAGAYHSSEISIVFGTFPANGTAAEYKLSAYMQKAWADFAKDPTVGPGWPKLGSNSGVELASLGRNGTGGEITIGLAGVDKICEVYEPVLATLPL